jgi:hypothetical protein
MIAPVWIGYVQGAILNIYHNILFMLVGIPVPISQDDTRIRRCDAAIGGSEAREKHAVGAGAQ